MSRLRLFLEWLAILACSALIVWWASAQGITSRMDLQLQDIAAARRAPAPALADDIVIVAIDQSSLEAVGRWPWDRRQVAGLIDQAAKGGARAVVLDVLYPEPSLDEADQALGASIAAAGMVALPVEIVPTPNDADGLTLIPPIAAIAHGAQVLGQVAIDLDGDSAVRRVPLFVQHPGGPAEHLQIALFRQLQGQEPQGLAAYRAGATPPVVPLRPAGSFRTLRASSLLAGEIPAAFLKNKLVFIGATAAGLGDLHPVPAYAGSMMAGVEIQANLLQALRGNAFIHDVAAEQALWLSLIPVALLFLGFWRLRPIACLALAMLLVIVWAGGCIALAAMRGLWLAPGPAMLAMILAYPLWGWRRLAAVDDFLGKQARLLTLGSAGGNRQAARGGFDSVAKHVSRLGFLVGEVAERRRFLTQVIETAPDAICVFADDGRLLLMNEKAEAIFGADQAGVTLYDLILGAGGTLNADGREMAMADGRTFAVDHARSGVEEAGAEVWAGLQVYAFSDVTEKRRAEEERRQMLEFLSHDMRSPQVAILGLSDDQRSRDPAAERMGRIAGHARRTLKLADDFVQLSRLAEAPLQIEEVHLGMLAEEAIDRAWFAAREKDIELHQEIAEAPVYVLADGHVLARAIDNLIGNAIRYGPQGSAVIIAVGEAPNGPQISISDAGPGMPEARRDDPFRRFGTSNREISGGAGLGLAFVKAAIDRHGARIACICPEGGGTRFELVFPALQQD